MVKISPQGAILSSIKSSFKLYFCHKSYKALLPGRAWGRRRRRWLLMGCKCARYANVWLPHTSARVPPCHPATVPACDGWSCLHLLAQHHKAGALIEASRQMWWIISSKYLKLLMLSHMLIHELFIEQASYSFPSNLKLLGSVRVTRLRNEAFLCSLNRSCMSW